MIGSAPGARTLAAAVVLLVVGGAVFWAFRTGGHQTSGRRAVDVVTAALLLVVGAAAIWRSHPSEHHVRLEVYTRSGTASEIAWYTGRQDRVGGIVTTPWSFSARRRGFGGLVTVAATSTKNDEVTCRILIDGKTVAESTKTFATACAYI